MASAGELPPDGECDETGLLVCAHGAAGGKVDCTTVTATSVECAWTSGHVWAGFSNLDVPGEANATWAWSLEVCVAGLCSVADAFGEDATCVWGPGTYCGDSRLDAGTEGPFDLAAGECIEVTVHSTVVVQAWVPAGLPALATATYETSGGDSGQECVLDGGR